MGKGPKYFLKILLIIAAYVFRHSLPLQSTYFLIYLDSLYER